MNQQEYFTEKMATLPEDLQEAIHDSDYAKTLANLQREYKLHIDQGQVMETLAMQLMFGDIDAPTFVNNMFNEAHVSSSTAGDMLLKIDMLILKKIRQHIEDAEEKRKREAEIDRMLLDEAEEQAEEESDIYANYYAESANIHREAMQELLDEGWEPDGSNVTDEMMAKELGITAEEFTKKKEVGGIKEARERESVQSFTLDPVSEREEMLRELESPEKSFVKPLFTAQSIPRSIEQVIKKEPEHIISPDHQLQNTHLETPYTEEILPPHVDNIQEAKNPIVIPQAPTPIVESSAIDPTTPITRTPKKIILTIDPYKEPIE